MDKLLFITDRITNTYATVGTCHKRANNRDFYAKSKFLRTDYQYVINFNSSSSSRAPATKFGTIHLFTVCCPFLFN